MLRSLLKKWKSIKLLNGEQYHQIASIPVLPSKLKKSKKDYSVTSGIVAKDKHILFEIFWAYWNHRTIHTREELMFIYLTEDYRVIAIGLEAVGDEERISWSAEPILDKAHLIKAKQLVVAHNHPGYDLEPTIPDIESAILFSEIAEENNITLYTNFIITGKREYVCY